MTMPNRATVVKLATSAPREARPAPLEKLREFLENEGMKSKTGPRSFADFERVGNMTPSKSSLDRLPKLISERWEDDREEFERALRDGFEIPEGSASIAISLDGVLAPIDGANRPTEVRAEAAAEGRISKGPAGYREASCATLSFCDEKGDLIGAVRLARAPETKKATLKKMLADEVGAVLRLQPALKVLKVADGAADNWAYLASDALPKGEQVVDFFHASEHLQTAIANVYGDGTRETRHRHEVLRDTLVSAARPPSFTHSAAAAECWAWRTRRLGGGGCRSGARAG